MKNKREEEDGGERKGRGQEGRKKGGREKNWKKGGYRERTEDMERCRRGKKRCRGGGKIEDKKERRGRNWRTVEMEYKGKGEIEGKWRDGRRVGMEGEMKRWR